MTYSGESIDRSSEPRNPDNSELRGIGVIGKDQRAVYRAMLLTNGGEWRSGMMGFGTHSRTDRVCEALTKKGVLEKVGETLDGYGHYKIVAFVA